jgi:hypothetical protein
MWCDGLLKFVLAGLWWGTIPILGIYALIVLFRPIPPALPTSQASTGQPATGPIIMAHRAARRPQGWLEIAASAVTFGLPLLTRAYEDSTEMVEVERWAVPNRGAISEGSNQDPPVPTKVTETVRRPKTDASGASCMAFGGVSSEASLKLSRMDNGFMGLGLVNTEAAIINERTAKQGGGL